MRFLLDIAVLFFVAALFIGAPMCIWWLSDHCYMGQTAGCRIYQERRAVGIYEWP